MRDFQSKANIGALPDSNSAEKYGAGEVNSLRTESKGTVSRAGLTLAPQDGTGEDTSQLAQAMFIHGAGASSFQAAGAANAITLTPVTGASGLKLPPDYASLNGMRVSFFAANTNTGATTFSVGQTAGTQFGTKKILDIAGADLAGGEIVAGEPINLSYDASADGGTGAAILIPIGNIVGPASSTDNALVRFDGVGGNAIQNSGWTLSDADEVAAGGALSMADNLVSRPVIKDYGETLNALGSIGGGTQDIDLESGNVVSGTVDTSTTTFTFSNPSAAGISNSFTMILTNGGSQTVNWPASVDWPGATPPTLTASGVDVIVFFTLDAGTIWYGFVSGLEMG